MKFAAIDIGSNAVRLQITNVIEYADNITFKRLEYVRFPLRLGHDVFNEGKLSVSSQERFIKLMQAYKLLIDLYKPDDYYGCATSAMRNAENGPLLVEVVKEKLGLPIEIIDGDKEADMINMALTRYIPEGLCLHIDVGGGSTELNLYHNKEKVTAQSFNLGSVRILEGKDDPKEWKNMQLWLKKNVHHDNQKVQCLGTGGNINKLFSMSGKKPGKLLSLQKIKKLRMYIENYSFQERVNILQLNEDRADVIIPASEIYSRVMEWSHSSQILVPDVGLKDGIMQFLYEKNIKSRQN